MAKKKIGINSRLYRNAGSYEAPTWTACNQISAAAIQAAWDKADASVRASRVKGGVKTQIDLSFTCSMRVSNTDAEYLLFFGAALSDDTIDLLILNGPIEDEGVRGFRYDAQVFSANEDQGLSVALYDELQLSPYIFDHNPALAVVGSGGSVTYTAI